MEYRVLGRTGLQASVMGLGCGGHSRLGLATGRSEENAIALVCGALALVCGALALGVNSMSSERITPPPR